MRKNTNEDIREFCDKYQFIYAEVIMAAIYGGILYIGKPMSVSAQKGVEDILCSEEKAKICEKIIDMLTYIDEHTNFEFSNEINLRKTEQRFNILKIQKNYKEMKKKEYKMLVKKLPLTEKLKVKFSK